MNNVSHVIISIYFFSLDLTGTSHLQCKLSSRALHSKMAKNCPNKKKKKKKNIYIYIYIYIPEVLKKVIIIIFFLILFQVSQTSLSIFQYSIHRLFSPDKL